MSSKSQSCMSGLTINIETCLIFFYSLYNAPDTGCGLFTSGGTESIGLGIWCDLDLEQKSLLLGNIMNKHKNTLKSMPCGQKSRVQARN